MTRSPPGIDIRSNVLPRIFIGLIPMLLIALPLFLWGQYQVREAGLLYRNGADMDAVVQRLWTVRRPVTTSAQAVLLEYWVEYDLVPPGSPAITKRVEIAKRTYIRLELARNRGEDPLLLTVRYLPDDPSVSSPDASAAVRDGWLRQLAALVVAALASLPLISALRSGLRLRRLGVPWRSQRT